jgi:hypothetical protein
MAGTALQDIKDFQEVVRLLEEHPEWRADLRRLILTDELLALPQEIAQLTRQVSRLSEQMATLTEIVQRVSVDVGRLKGDGLEERYTLRGVPSITRAVRRPVSLSPEELDTVLEEGYWGSRAQESGLRRKGLSQRFNKTGSSLLGRGERQWTLRNACVSFAHLGRMQNQAVTQGPKSLTGFSVRVIPNTLLARQSKVKRWCKSEERSLGR